MKSRNIITSKLKNATPACIEVMTLRTKEETDMSFGEISFGEILYSIFYGMYVN